MTDLLALDCPANESRHAATGRPRPPAPTLKTPETDSRSTDHDATATPAIWPLRRECSRSRSIRYAAAAAAAPVTLRRPKPGSYLVHDSRYRSASHSIGQGIIAGRCGSAPSPTALAPAQNLIGLCTSDRPSAVAESTPGSDYLPSIAQPTKAAAPQLADADHRLRRTNRRRPTAGALTTARRPRRPSGHSGRSVRAADRSATRQPQPQHL
jgi:hypothetical protein